MSTMGYQNDPFARGWQKAILERPVPNRQKRRFKVMALAARASVLGEREAAEAALKRMNAREKP